MVGALTVGLVFAQPKNEFGHGVLITIEPQDHIRPRVIVRFKPSCSYVFQKLHFMPACAVANCFGPGADFFSEFFVPIQV